MTGVILMLIALIAVAIILFAGLATMFVGGEFSRTWSNRLMRYRVLAQFVAVLIIIVILIFSGR